MRKLMLTIWLAFSVGIAKADYNFEYLVGNPFVEARTTSFEDGSFEVFVADWYNLEFDHKIYSPSAANQTMINNIFNRGDNNGYYSFGFGN